MPQLNWAAPSWVIPGSIAENACFLAGKTPGIALCLFETKSSLAYASEDLPDALACLPLEWHIHLPLDLPWENGAKEVAAICARLLNKTAFLKPVFAVLHPPGTNARLLAQFSACIHFKLPILLENTSESNILDLGGLAFLHKHGFGFCMDVGHALGYAQKTLTESELPAAAALWHWSAPGNADRHLPMNRLDASQMEICVRLAAKARHDARHLLEIFSWQGILASIPIFTTLFDGGGNDNENRAGDSL